MESEPRLLLTIGDPAGVGPEVVLKALPNLKKQDYNSIGVIGAPAYWELAADKLGLPSPEALGVPVIAPGGYDEVEEEMISDTLFCGRKTAAGARMALASLETASDLAYTSPDQKAVITAPINKSALHDLGVTVPGLTEWFAARFGVETPLMLLVGGELRVALITTHLPIRDVTIVFTVDLVEKKIAVLYEDLRKRFGLKEPRIALLALNPHGASQGEEDREEVEILCPAVNNARAGGIEIEGPFSADAFFGRRSWTSYDAVLASYHDQGLIPVKMEAAGTGVNVTLGLPIIRTSPDHGTAFDIAGRGLAEEGATVAAVKLADALLDGRGAF